MNKLLKDKKAQLTIFVIIGILILATTFGYVLLKNNKRKVIIPEEFRPVEDRFISCLENVLENSVSLAEEQGGYINLPKFEAASIYEPTSNMLDFFGTAVPFWYYASGNGIIKEQLPSKEKIEKDLTQFTEENFYCDFSDLREKGFSIDLDNLKILNTKIEKNKITQDVSADLKISFNNKTLIVKNHKVELKSNFGELFDTAINLYNTEKKTSFLENYTIDILYLYAPVSGVELTCSPKIWEKDEVSENIKSAIENNFIFLRPQSDYYSIKSKEEKYFIFNFKTDKTIRFIYSKKWPTKIDVEPSTNNILIAEPIGNQPGLGIIGFCYVPYHFVYDLSIPIMIQIYDEKEFFQFPIVIIIRKNTIPKKAEAVSYIAEQEICKYKTKEISIFTYNENLEPVSANISFKCLNELCEIGTTEEGSLDALVPACVNGFIIAQADKYKTEKYQISTNEESEAYIIMKRIYPVNLEIYSNGILLKDNALVYLTSEDYYETIYWPNQKNLNLVEGDYNISVIVFRNSSLVLPESNYEKCVDVPKGIGGIFGLTKKECFNVVIPKQEINNVVVGGGKISTYLTSDELKKRTIKIDVGDLSIPQNLEDLQKNYNLIENKKIELKT